MNIINKDFNNIQISKVLSYKINIVEEQTLPEPEPVPVISRSPNRPKSRRKTELRTENIGIDLINNSESDNSDDYIDSPRVNNRSAAVKRKSNRRSWQTKDSNNNYYNTKKEKVLSSNFSKDGTGYEPLYKLEELLKKSSQTTTNTSLMSTPANTADQDDREFEFQEHIINQPVYFIILYY